MRWDKDVKKNFFRFEAERYRSMSISLAFPSPEVLSHVSWTGIEALPHPDIV